MSVAFSKRGFVLVEILLLVLILVILAGIALITIKSGGSLAQRHNMERSTGIQSILNAIGQYQADNNGAFPFGIPVKTPLVIGSNAGQANICETLVPKYLATLPFDPTATAANFTSCADYSTEYTLIESEGHVTVAAPRAELGQTISATR